PAPDPAIFLSSVGLGLLLSGIWYWHTDAGWKSREFYRPALSQMALDIGSHARAFYSAQDDNDYFKMQNAAHEASSRQISWLNDNVGGIAAKAYGSANGEPNYLVKNTRLSPAIDKRRAQYTAELYGKATYLENLRKDDSEWPKRPSEIVRMKGIPRYKSAQ
ncbi:hypothetical protein HHL08_24525, partial [Sphingobium sp. AR-3-1]